MKHFQLYFLIALLLLACDHEDESPVDIGKDYFPASVGDFQVYSVDQTVYTELEDPIALHFELLTEVIDSFPGTDGIYTYVIHRSKRESASDPWQYLDTWSVRINDLEAVVNEENTPYVKITFPAREGKSWDGNKFNVSGADDYEMKDVGKSFSAGDMVFENTIFVDQEEQEDLLFNIKRFEVFAKGVGLIYKEVTDLSYCDDVGCFGRQEIKSGVIYKQSIIEYGAN